MCGLLSLEGAGPQALEVVPWLQAFLGLVSLRVREGVALGTRWPVPEGRKRTRAGSPDLCAASRGRAGAGAWASCLPARALHRPMSAWHLELRGSHGTPKHPGGLHGREPSSESPSALS